MKKIIKWIGYGFGGILVLAIIGTLLGPKDEPLNLVPTFTPTSAVVDTPIPIDTPVPAAPDQPTVSVELATVTPIPTDTPTPAELPQPTVSPIPTTPSQPSGPIANNTANLREGPGTEYQIRGGIEAGDALQIVGRNSAGDWYQLSDGAWIAAFLVDNAPADLVVAAVPLQLPGGNPAPAVDNYQGWTETVNGIEFRSECPCNQGDTLNCGDFGVGFDAQACFLKCQQETGRDIHGLDGDSDGDACEWEW